MRIFSLKKKITLLFFVLLIIPKPLLAAVVYVEASKAEYLTGEDIVLKIKIDPEAEVINAFEINLAFDPELLEFIDFNKENSILSVWIENPEGNKDLLEDQLSFIGGVPNGYQGKFLGTELSANLLAEIKFKAKENILAQNLPLKITEESMVLLNNGTGKKASLTIDNIIWQENEKKISLKALSRALYLLENFSI